MTKQCIHCRVNSCRYHNNQDNLCQLDAIEVEPCKNCCSGKPEDESCCGSYNQK